MSADIMENIHVADDDVLRNLVLSFELTSLWYCPYYNTKFAHTSSFFINRSFFVTLNSIY